MERLWAMGNTKSIKTLLRDTSKINRVMEAFSREDWTDMDRIIYVSNYLEYGEASISPHQQIKMNPKIRAQIREVDINQLQEQFKGAEYRKIVQQHLRKVGPRLELALSAAVEALTVEERKVAEGLIDEYNHRGYQQDFWRRDCADILKDICNEFAQAMSHVGSNTDERIMFNMFQIITMNFALQARNHKGLRAFAGIRKNWLFR